MGSDEYNDCSRRYLREDLRVDNIFTSARVGPLRHEHEATHVGIMKLLSFARERYTTENDDQRVELQYRVTEGSTNCTMMADE